MEIMTFFLEMQFVIQLNVMRMQYDAVLTAVGTEPTVVLSCNADTILMIEVASLLHFVEMFFRPYKIVSFLLLIAGKVPSCPFNLRIN